MSVEIDTSPFDKEIEQCEAEMKSFGENLKEIDTFEREIRTIRETSNMFAMMHRSIPQPFVGSSKLDGTRRFVKREQQKSKSRKQDLETLKQQYTMLVKMEVIPRLAKFNEDFQKVTIDRMRFSLLYGERGEGSPFEFLDAIGVTKETIDKLDAIASAFARTTK